MIGSNIAGKYEVLRRIGKGGMGAVFEAEHTATGRRVALKVLSKNLLTEDDSMSDLSESIRADFEETVLRFEREARVAARIDSDHVVQILDAGRDSVTGRPYMVMELLRGDNLSQAFKRLGALQPDTALRIVAQTCRGLVAAHEAGVIHRDIKMGNILLTERGEGQLVVKLLDFGIARVRMDEFHKAHQDPLTRTGSVLGSPQYMAPEQASGLKTLDHRADLWSLSVVLYRTLSARTPYDERTLGGLILALHTKQPVPLQDVAPWVSPRVAAIVHRGLQRDPDQRFGSAREMLEALLVELPDGVELHEGLMVGVSDEARAVVAPRMTPVASPDVANAEEPTRIAASSATHLEFRTSQPPTRPRRPGVVGVGIAALILGATVITAWRMLPAETVEPGAGAATEASTAAAEASADATETANDEQERGLREVELAVEPPDATVLVDGEEVPVVDGAVTISGPLGSIHPVEIRSGRRSETAEVAITEQGAKPEAIALSPSRVARPSSGGSRVSAGSPPSTAAVASPARPPAPPPALPPPSKPGHVSATESFE